MLFRSEEKVEKKEKAKAEEKVEKKEEAKAEEKVEQPVTASLTKARATEERYTIKFRFDAIPDSLELPQAVLDKLPKDIINVANGTDIHLPKFDDVEVEGGKWKFLHWEAYPIIRGARGIIEGDGFIVNGSDLILLGKWGFEASYFIEFEFKSITDGKDLPQEVLNKLPEKQTGIPSNSTVTLPEMTDVKVDGGTWKFVRWTWDAYYRGIRDAGQDNFVYVDQDLLVTGEWEYIEDPEPEKYNVTYKFVSETAGEEIPQDVLDKRPANQTDVLAGTNIPLENLGEVIVPTGVWRFVKWTAKIGESTIDLQNSIQVDNQDLEIVGHWIYEAYPPLDKHTVFYVFESGTDGKDLPQEVMDKKPADNPNALNGSPVQIFDIEDVEVADGTWKLEGWYREVDGERKLIDSEVMVEDEDITVYGVWKFTEKNKDPETEKYKVIFEFISVTEDKEIPAEVMAKKPADKSDVENGTKINLENYEDVKVEGGTWKFVGWYSIKGADFEKVENEVVVNNADLHLVAQWKFEEDKKPAPPKPLKPQKPKVQKGRMLPKTNVESAFSYVILALAGIGGAYITKKKYK